MAKKTLPQNPSNDKSLREMMEESTGVLALASGGADQISSKTRGTYEDKSSNRYSWQRYTIVCDKELLGKVHGIASMEGVTIREIIEHCLHKGVASYEKKHGSISVVKKDIDEIM